MKLRSLPDSLFLRLSLLVILTVVATQIITLVVVVNERRALIAKQFYEQVIDTLADFEGRLDSIPPAMRPAYIQSYNHPWLPQLFPANADRKLTFSSSLTPFEATLAARITKELGDSVKVKVRYLHDARQLWIAVHVLDDPYWLVVPMGRFRDNIFGPILIAALLAAFCAILVASAIAWRITMPISKVVAASRALERGRSPQPLNEHIGPREIRKLSAGFNRMSSALATSASERRLMLAGLSHDLRTPLTRLKLMVELQGETADSPGMLSDLDEMSSIVRQFIDFARSEEKPSIEQVSLAELASSVVARFIRENFPIQLTISAEPEITADPLALERMLSNLIENARRYGRPPIEVQVAETETEATLSVLDHGEGIPPDLHAAALAPFERLAAHRGTDGGSGLGLAIVSRIVKQHNGSLVFENTPEHTFRICIRLPKNQ